MGLSWAAAITDIPIGSKNIRASIAPAILFIVDLLGRTDRLIFVLDSENGLLYAALAFSQAWERDLFSGVLLYWPADASAGALPR